MSRSAANSLNVSLNNAATDQPFERHADPLDEAAALSAAITASAIEAARKANAPEYHPDFDGESCVDCGDTIPAGRLEMGKVRCTRCQGIREHREKQVARNPKAFSWDSPES